MSNSEIENTFKLLLIGNSGTGKSSLMLRFTTDKFQSVIPTVGVDFKVKLHEYSGHMYKLLIWDTAGQERFRTLTSSYYRGAHGVMVVYDVSNRASFVKLDLWMQELERYHAKKIPRILIGNKVDKEGQREVPTADGEAFANQNGMKFVECSAKANIHVQDAFQDLVGQMAKAAQDRPDRSSQRQDITLTEQKKPSSGMGCMC